MISKKGEIFENEVMYSLETFIGVAGVLSLLLKDDLFNELFYKKHDDKIHINTKTITFKE